MVKTYNRDYVQSFAELRREFQCCHFLIRATAPGCNEGYLIAVSDDPDTEEELSSLRKSLSDNDLVFIGGIYGNRYATNLQRIINGL